MKLTNSFMKLKIFTDGASRGNPGNASYGFVISDGERVIYKEGKTIGVTTNNIAEYTAVFEALKYVKNNFKNTDSRIELFSDSKLVVEQLSGKYKIKAKHLKQIIEKIQILAIDLGRVIYSHIPRSQNSLADKLANKALDQKLW